MRTWIYPNLVNILKEECKLYLNQGIDVKDIQKKIYEIESKIVSFDEKWFRQILFEVENKIELYSYTVESKSLNLFVIPLIESLLKIINAYEQTKDPIEVLIKNF